MYPLEIHPYSAPPSSPLLSSPYLAGFIKLLLMYLHSFDVNTTTKRPFRACMLSCKTGQGCGAGMVTFNDVIMSDSAYPRSRVS